MCGGTCRTPVRKLRLSFPLLCLSLCPVFPSALQSVSLMRMEGHSSNTFRRDRPCAELTAGRILPRTSTRPEEVGAARRCCEKTGAAMRVEEENGQGWREGGWRGTELSSEEGNNNSWDESKRATELSRAVGLQCDEHRSPRR